MKISKAHARIPAFLSGFIISDIAPAADGEFVPAEQRPVADVYQHVDGYRSLSLAGERRRPESARVERRTGSGGQKVLGCVAAARADLQTIVQPNLRNVQLLRRPACRRRFRLCLLLAAAQAATDDCAADQCRRSRACSGHRGSERHQRNGHNRHRLVRAFAGRQTARRIDVGEWQRRRHACTCLRWPPAGESRRRFRAYNIRPAAAALAWRADSKGFWYTRYPGTERPAAERHFFQQIYFHRLGEDPAKDSNVLGKDFPKVAEIKLEARFNPQLVIASVANGDGGEFAHYVIDTRRNGAADLTLRGQSCCGRGGRRWRAVLGFPTGGAARQTAQACAGRDRFEPCGHARSGKRCRHAGKR